MNLGEKALATMAIAVPLATGLLISLEGYSTKPYLDVAGVLTECYGNTHGVKRNVIKTKEECEALLQNEVYRIGVMIVKDLPNLNTNELASVVSWTYNVGDGAYRSSTLRKRFKVGEHTLGCTEMYKWKYITSHGRKVVSKGLNNRRAKEVQLCLTPVY